MKTFQHRTVSAALFALVLSVSALVLISVVAIVRVGIESVSQFDLSDVSFFIVVGLFVAAAVYAKANWKQRSTFIAVGQSRTVVLPADRRDELV